MFTKEQQQTWKKTLNTLVAFGGVFGLVALIFGIALLLGGCTTTTKRNLEPGFPSEITIGGTMRLSGADELLLDSSNNVTVTNEAGEEVPPQSELSGTYTLTPMDHNMPASITVIAKERITITVEAIEKE